MDTNFREVLQGDRVWCRGCRTTWDLAYERADASLRGTGDLAYGCPRPDVHGTAGVLWRSFREA